MLPKTALERLGSPVVTWKSSSYEIFTEKQIAEAFEVFDEDRKGKAKLKHLGTIVRAVGRVPTLQDLEDLASKVEDEEYPGYFRLPKLLPYLTEILMKDNWKSSTEEGMIRAFRILDADRKGVLESAFLRKLFTEQGDNFSSEEIEKFLNTSSDPAGNINYKELCADLVASQMFDIAESRRKIREKLVDDRYRMC
ncbi:dynein regulatory complex protein 8 [Trichonephila inaurata madagascariensis]|uniref:Dynein regulatory complex protein 8 n=1 Tax=Trichonephila inaurata madagascariensis TaxID=2747483 RepID=A0A8X7CKI6_9ARAC|nr:dynein regulatory complex protein 8 [Trichonephila inaurata madagascariensis]